MSSNIYRGVAHVPDDPRVIAAAALLLHMSQTQDRLRIAYEQRSIAINLLQSINEGVTKDEAFLERLDTDFETMFGIPFPKEFPKEGEDVIEWLSTVLPERKSEKAPQTPEGSPRRIRRPGKAESPSTGRTDPETTSKRADYKITTTCAKRGHVFEERVEGEQVCDDCGYVERVG